MLIGEVEQVTVMEGEDKSRVLLGEVTNKWQRSQITNIVRRGHITEQVVVIEGEVKSPTL